MRKSGKLDNSKSDAIHSQRFHQQVEIAAMIWKNFVRIVGKHIANLIKIPA